MKIVRNLAFNSSNETGDINNSLIENSFNSIDMGMCIINEKNFIKYVNNKFLEILNMNKIQLLNRKIHKIIYNDLISKSIKLKESVSGKVQSPDGIQMNLETQVIYDKFDNYCGLMIIYSDRVEVEKDKKIFKIDSKENFINPYENIISRNNELIRELIKAKKASKSEATIMINGESGTGKEILANEIHNSSNRSENPFVAVNCGAIPENLFESHLFGHKKGSFTGAIEDKVGKIECANGGTLFLDEIGELPLNMQVKLLRVIQERRITKVGCNCSKNVDIRIIAATNRDLNKMVENGKFREDLFYRLNVIPIKLIPLRKRKNDVSLLVEYFKNIYVEKNKMADLKIEKSVIKALEIYEWPGNIRELKNIIERMIVLKTGDTIRYSDLPYGIINIYEENRQQKVKNLINYKFDGSLEKFSVYEKEIYKQAYELHGSFNSAAKALGVNHKTVASKLRKYNII